MPVLDVGRGSLCSSRGAEAANRLDIHVGDLLLTSYLRLRRLHTFAGFDRRADEIAPLRPASVVVLHVVLAEQVLHHEPSMTRPLADPAIGNCGLGEIDAG